MYKTLKHPNIIKLIDDKTGADWHLQDGVRKVSYMVLEYLPHGDLFDFIEV